MKIEAFILFPASLMLGISYDEERNSFEIFLLLFALSISFIPEDEEQNS